jgi:hypothetical protein
VAGFPGLGLLRRLRHAPGHQQTTCLPAWSGRPGRFPRSPVTAGRGRRPAMPRQPRHAYAAALPRGLLAGPSVPASESPTIRRACTADRPISTRFEPALPLAGGSTTGSLRVTPSCLACRTRTVWRCRSVPSLSGLLPPSLASPRSGCPQLRRPAATGRRRSPCSSARSMAPRGARTGRCRRSAVDFLAAGAAGCATRGSRHPRRCGGCSSWPPIGAGHGGQHRCDLVGERPGVRAGAGHMTTTSSA